MRKKIVFILFFICFFIFSLEAQTTFTSSQGFSVDTPANWIVEQSDSAFIQTKPETAEADIVIMDSTGVATKEDAKAEINKIVGGFIKKLNWDARNFKEYTNKNGIEFLLGGGQGIDPKGRKVHVSFAMFTTPQNQASVMFFYYTGNMGFTYGVEYSDILESFRH